MTARHHRRREPQLNEEPNGELHLERRDDRSGRVGDLRRPEDVAEQFPKERERLAGRTGGETTEGDLTADDASAETLLDEDRSHSPQAQEERQPLDTELREVDEADIGEGGGLDEAELARRDPVGRQAPPSRDVDPEEGD
jgi:hypothetical protein